MEKLFSNYFKNSSLRTNQLGTGLDLGAIMSIGYVCHLVLMCKYKNPGGAHVWGWVVQATGRGQLRAVCCLVVLSYRAVIRLPSCQDLGVLVNLSVLVSSSVIWRFASLSAAASS